MAGALGFKPPKAQPVAQVPPRSPWESRPFCAKFAIVAPAAIAQLIAAAFVPPPQPNWLVVADMAVRAAFL